MKSIKKIYTNYFFHVNSETGRSHGLWNDLENLYPVGYILSTLSIPVVKQYWLKYLYKSKN
jgi:hypothetical protein